MLGLLSLWHCKSDPTTVAEVKESEEYVFADLYYRYQPADDLWTVEARLTLRDKRGTIDTPYVSPGGVSFLGSDLPQQTSLEGSTRYRSTFPIDIGSEARFTITNVDGERVTINRTLVPYDTLIMGPSPHKNYGFTVYPGDLSDTLTSEERLRVYFIPDNGSAKMATLVGPTPPDQGYIFGRGAISDWPFSSGKFTFARVRTSNFAEDGVLGVMTEEVFSDPITDAVVN